MDTAVLVEYSRYYTEQGRSILHKTPRRLLSLALTFLVPLFYLGALTPPNTVHSMKTQAQPLRPVIHPKLSISLTNMG